MMEELDSFLIPRLLLKEKLLQLFQDTVASTLGV